MADRTDKDVSGSDRHRERAVVLLAAGLIVFALLTVFAIELSNTQAKSRRDVESRVNDRAVLAGALIDSLFQSVLQQIPQEARTYGAPSVSNRTMQANRQQNLYLALLTPSGRVLAHSKGFTAQARSDLKLSTALALVRAGRPYALGNELPYGNTRVADFAVALPTRSGVRVLLSGISPTELAPFFAADLRKIPGVKGSENYVIDGNRRVLAASSPKVRPGSVLNTSAEASALAERTADVAGHYYDQVRLANSTWMIVLVSPDGPLFASVSGLRKWVPWLIFGAFALVAAIALVLALGAMRAAEQVRGAKARLEVFNKELEDANAALHSRAAELARSNSELEQFASIASHDLQEPLRKVRTFTQELSLTESEQLSERGRDYLERANAAAERMQRLIEDLLKFSRVATHGRPFEPVDLGQVTGEVLRDLELEVSRAGAVVEVGKLPTVLADELQMRQLMQNLISNALKFRREGVTPRVEVEARGSEDQLRLIVRDNGIGFEPEYATRIFRVFERLHGRGRYPGTGIGLALCRKIAERHGGTIVAESQLGEGSTFTVILPLRAAEPATTTRAGNREGDLVNA